jgi:hypothetical protein
MPLLRKQSVLESLSLGMVLIIQLLKLVQESNIRMVVLQTRIILNLTVLKPADALLQTIWRSFSWNGTDCTTTQTGTKTFKTDVLLIKY